VNDSGVKPVRVGRRRTLPLRLKLAAHGDGPAHERVLRDCFRIGYGDDCDIQLPGGPGPGVVFEVENARGPLLIARALPPEEISNYVDVQIDGEPLVHSQQTLKPGARVDITDKATQRCYRMVVDSLRPHPWLRPRNLAIVIGVLALLGAAFGGYLYRSVIGTRSEVQRTSERMERAEAALQRTAQELIDSVGKMGTTDAELASAIYDLKLMQGTASRELYEEFTRRIAQIEREGREDIAQRAKTARDAQARFDQLRDEFSQRMVAAYQQLKDLERNVLETMAQRFAARGPPRTALKQVLATSRNAVLFVRTQYRVTLGEEAGTRELWSLGTGFLVSDDGLAVTAQHVLYPWRYDKELLVLTTLGLAQVIPDSVRWSVWPAGRTVLDDPADLQSYHEADAVHSDGLEPKLRVLAAPQPRLTLTMVPSPIGMVELQVPLPGRSDVVVFQIDTGDASLPHLTLSDARESVEPLDEVLAIGYPYSRLKDGQAWPQGVRGFVRRVGDELLEIDAAVHPGLSGGPLLSAHGKVLGMLSAIIGSEVYAVAVLASDIRTVIDDAREHMRETARAAGVN